MDRKIESGFVTIFYERLSTVMTSQITKSMGSGKNLILCGVNLTNIRYAERR